MDTSANTQKLREDILELKRQNNAIILAHNYVQGDVQDIADFVGDSLELSRKAAENHAENIVFCGVRFMGETAKLLSPRAHVLMPTQHAGCPMADMCPPHELRQFKEDHPDHFLIAYVNTTAETKALVDLCVTSGNAEKILRKIDTQRPILFLPDQNLGANLNQKLGLHMDLWNGCCRSHNRIATEAIELAKQHYPDAPVLVHLECRPEVVAMADAALSTAGILAYAKNSTPKSFIIGTESGILHRLKKENPDKDFHGLWPNVICPDMKKITLQGVHDALSGKGFEIQIPDELIAKAVAPIQRMLEHS